MNDINVITIANNEKFLRQISTPVELTDSKLPQDIAILEQYCKESPVLAIAAVQLGIPKRIIYLKNSSLDIVRKLQNDKATEEDHNHNEAKVLINPVITLKEGLTDYWEACASCLDYMGHVNRPYRIQITYQDLSGNTHVEGFEGFPSTVLCHEMDHLDGILHMDIATECLSMPAEERKVFRRTHDYNIVSRTGSFEKLVQNKKKN